ncbi:spore coat protein U domain-containing protein [Amylibacter marinus]|uniref:spore coat protein U domain-containing protein n=1 Tax=Amylibacter marinus TaxID=1475483 RepID=UPI003D68567E
MRGRNTPWGDLPTNDVGSMVIGCAQTFNAYGRVHQGLAPAFGSYADLVIVTVEYSVRRPPAGTAKPIG